MSTITISPQDLAYAETCRTKGEAAAYGYLRGQVVARDEAAATLESVQRWYVTRDIGVAVVMVAVGFAFGAWWQRSRRPIPLKTTSKL